MSLLRQSASVLFLFFGILFAANATMGPCGGAPLTSAPMPAILISIFGLELVLVSYLFVRGLKHDADYRTVIYLILLCYSLGLLALPVDVMRDGAPHSRAETHEFVVSLVRGLAAFANLALFYRWTGVRNMIRWGW